MKVIKVKNYDEMSYELFKLYEQQILRKPDSCLSFTTGGTPDGMAKYFVDAVNAGLDISQTTILNLDEYVGEKKGIYSVYTWMHEHVYDLIKTQPKNIFYLYADATDKETEIKRYGDILERFPRDIQMCGLGTNGHIGANEPGTSFDSTLFLADSDESTIQSTKALYGLNYEDTPRQMYTLGFKEIMDAKCVVLAVSGTKKAKALKALIEGPVSEDCPASLLKTHKNFILIYDEEAGSLLEEK